MTQTQRDCGVEDHHPQTPDSGAMRTVSVVKAIRLKPIHVNWMVGDWKQMQWARGTEILPRP